MARSLGDLEDVILANIAGSLKVLAPLGIDMSWSEARKLAQKSYNDFRNRLGDGTGLLTLLMLRSALASAYNSALSSFQLCADALHEPAQMEETFMEFIEETVGAERAMELFRESLDPLDLEIRAALDDHEAEYPAENFRTRLEVVKVQLGELYPRAEIEAAIERVMEREHIERLGWEMYSHRAMREILGFRLEMLDLVIKLYCALGHVPTWDRVADFLGITMGARNTIDIRGRCSVLLVMYKNAVSQGEAPGSIQDLMMMLAKQLDREGKYRMKAVKGKIYEVVDYTHLERTFRNAMAAKRILIGEEGTGGSLSKVEQFMAAVEALYEALPAPREARR